MCDKAVNTYPSTIQLVPDRCMSQEICDEAADKCPFFVRFCLQPIEDSRIV